jgi:hypothetical protein
MLQLEDSNVFVQRHARRLLDLLDKGGRISKSYAFPLQLWSFGQDLTLVGMAGEVVVDYGIMLREEAGSNELWVAGYCNDVFAYIPSRRILSEGGYEAVDSMIYYGQPSSFDPVIEDKIMMKFRKMSAQLKGAE